MVSYSDSNLKKYHILQVSMKGRFQVYATVIWLKYCRYSVKHYPINYLIPTYLGPCNLPSSSILKLNSTQRNLALTFLQIHNRQEIVHFTVEPIYPELPLFVDAVWNGCSVVIYHLLQIQRSRNPRIQRLPEVRPRDLSPGNAEISIHTDSLGRQKV